MALNVSAGVNTFPGGPDLSALLARAGYVLRGNRARCPSCEGRSDFTVGIYDHERYLCFRCKRAGNLRTLQRELALPVAPETIEERKAQYRARQFREWVRAAVELLNRRLRRLASGARWAHVALAYDPEDEAAWDALADFYNGEAELEGALELLSFEKVPRWLEQPVAREKVFAAFGEGLGLGC